MSAVHLLRHVHTQVTLLTRHLLCYCYCCCCCLIYFTQVLQYGSIHSAVATLSSLQSAADLSAAIAAAPSQAALQSLAAEAAAVPQQSWLAQEYKVSQGRLLALGCRLFPA
jgi:hypothetical protein